MTNLVAFNQYHTKPKHPRRQMLTQWKVASVNIIIVKVITNVILAVAITHGLFSVIIYNSIIIVFSVLHLQLHFQNTF